MTGATYIARAGERLDLICHRHYGHLNGTVEAVLAANPGLAARINPAHLSGGEVLILPAPAARRSTLARRF